MIWMLCLAFAYLLGSVPFGVIIASSRGVDIRTRGSKNIGATNVGRVLGARWGLLCFALDMSKGAGPVILAGLLNDLYTPSIFDASTGWWLWLLVAMAALLGHMYSLFLRGGGGKGVATAFGALLAMWPVMTVAAGIAFVIWILFVAVFRYISLASVVAALTLPVSVGVLINQQRADRDLDLTAALTSASAPLFVTILLAILVIWKHRSNLSRLAAGTEPRIGTPRD